MLKFVVAASIAAAALTAPAAATFVYDTPTTTPGNQAWTGTLGLNFRVLAGQSVTFNSFGAFDAGTDGITGPISVGIFDANTQTIITPVAVFTNSASNGTAYITQKVSAFTLTEGLYQLATWGFSATDNNYNTFGNNPGLVSFNDLAGRLQALDAAYSAADAGGQFATEFDPGQTRYGAGTVGFVPEPATWGLLLAGFGMLQSIHAHRRLGAS